MSLFKSFRLGLLHVVAAITLVPITGVLNRLMIFEFGILATVVAVVLVFVTVAAPAVVLFVLALLVLVPPGAVAALGLILIMRRHPLAV